MITHPNSNHRFKSRHAEFNAFVNSGRNIRGATVYVFRENKLGVLSNAKPCEACQRLLIEHGAKKVIYTFENTYKEEKIA
jgi:deoxycytidylate deaminase